MGAQPDELLSPALDGSRFWTCLWGYQKHDVDLHLAEVARAYAELEHALAASEALVVELRRQVGAQSPAA